MAGANPQRTSWVAEEVDPSASENFGVEWYRPIEAYIGQHVQLITARNKVYVATARGLYALAADTGDEVWRFDTELPLGNSPTVVGDTVFVGGFDRHVYALNADTGAPVWTFGDAKGGFSTNPLVVEGKVLLGSRDGYFYALDQANGALLWRYPEQGQSPLAPILYSAAYANGVVIFAANDNFAYALNVTSGALVWRSAKLPGDGYQAWWPVVYDNYVVLSAALPYAESASPGTVSVANVVSPDDPYYAEMHDFQYGYDFSQHLQTDDIFHQNEPEGALLGPSFAAGSAGDTTGLAWSWAKGKTVVDASKATEYLENNGQERVNRPTNKPWRRTVIILNIADGGEYTFDSDGDSFPEYAPLLYAGTKSGNRYPPLVIPTKNEQGQLNDVLYAQNMESYQPGWSISHAILTGWQFGTQYVHPVGQWFAIDEPFANSAGGSIIYANLCCDRVGTWFDIDNDSQGNPLWSYNLESVKLPSSQIEPWQGALAPGYDMMWQDASVFDYYPRLYGEYGTTNGIYHNHGLQNPIIPYQGRLFVHRSNAIIAFGPHPTQLRQPAANETPAQYEANIRQEYPQVSRPLLKIGDPDVPEDSTLTVADAQELLDTQIAQMLRKGHLRPGYYNSLRGSVELANYFENPGDTLLTLVQAYPLVADSLKPDLERYIKQHFKMYFVNEMEARTGYWLLNPTTYDLTNPSGYGQLQAREWMPLPPEVALDIKTRQPDFWPTVNWPWSYPQQNFYAMWKYAALFYADNPAELQNIYELAKSRLEPTATDNDTLIQKPWVHNGYITGYEGFLHLQELAGKSTADSALRTQVQAELDRLLQLRANDFRKDHPWVEDLRDHCCETDIDRRALNVARNFMNMSPELAAYLRDNAFETVSQAIDEYERVAPYWLAARYEATFGELASDNLYTNASLFQAKAQILQEPVDQLLKYVDMPAFETGDLFYIRNLIAVVTDPPPGIRLSISPSPLTLTKNGSATLTINVEASGGYSGTVMLEVSSPSADLQIQPATIPVQAPGTTTVTVQDLADVSVAAAERTYQLTINATGTEVAQTRHVTVQIAGNTLLLPSIRRINAPHFDGEIRFSEMAIAWFGQVHPTDNYVDVRVGYNDQALMVDLAPFDRYLWYDETPSPADFTDWDAGTVYLRLGSESYQLQAQLGGDELAYKADGSNWVTASVPFTASIGWRGYGMNDGAEAKGWRVTYEIPFQSLGLAGPPPPGTVWKLGLVGHDRDDAAGTPIPVQVWPEALDTQQPQTWGDLRFGIPSYTPPTTTQRNEVTIRQGVNGAVVPDAEVGGHTTCGGDPALFFDEWGANNFAGTAQINIQNQADIADWPCFSKYYVTFPLDALPAGKAVISATLTLFMFGNAGQNHNPSDVPDEPEPAWIQPLTVADDWDEATVTWNNAPLALENVGGAWVDPIALTDPTVPYTWDVSRAVAQSYASSKPLRLVLYTAAGEYHSGKYFWSSDADEAVRPELRIAWGDSTDNPGDPPPDPDPTPDDNPPPGGGDTTANTWLPLLSQ